MKGTTACRRFEGRKGLIKKYSRRRRKEVFEELKSMSVRLANKLGLQSKSEVASAWRLAVETWLRKHDIISVHKCQKVSPILSQLFTH
ncbi:MAG: hypothetical protein C0404_04715 [Verrucomicrobia bacterium]|nr:hypothetical protein [Verrucomicrobiota bacterium]